jgi:hypothetical protein
MAIEITLQAQIQGLRTAIEGQLQSDERSARAELPWKAGERVTGVVEAVRPGERALLRIGAYTFDVRLPPGTQTGQRLDLTFVGASPRITFALPEEQAAVPVTRRPVEISPAARNLNALVQTVAPQRVAQPTPAVDPRPLLPAPPAQTALLAAALQRSVETSGLFYESHLEQWAAGERPLALLLREPQGQMRAPAAAVVTAAAPSDVREEAVQSPASESRGQARAAGPQPALESIDQRLTAQVRAQIESLDARQIVWQGHAWPGQAVEWRIEEPPEERRDGEDETPVAWTSHLKLVLPQLGEVTAELTLAAGALRLRLHAPDQHTRSALTHGQSSLGDALEQARIRLTEFAVDE